MKIAICGSGTVFDESISEKAASIGRAIAENDHVVLTGACNGYPNEAAKAAFEIKGKVMGFSPARDNDEHVKFYNFPTGNFTELIFTGLGIPERNIPLVRNSDAVILIDGKIGTLNEFSIAMHLGKKIGVLKGAGGISDLIPKMAEVIDKHGEKENIVYNANALELLEKLISIVTFK